MRRTLLPHARSPGRSLARASALACLLWLAAAAPVSAQEPGAHPEDLSALENLHAAGVDLSRPLRLEFAFHFASRAGARSASRVLAREGFRGKLEPAGGAGDYFLFASKPVRADATTLLALRQRFEALARVNGGSYEGWGLP